MKNADKQNWRIIAIIFSFRFPNELVLILDHLISDKRWHVELINLHDFHLVYF